MAWSHEILGAPAVGEGAERALRVPLGMASPFWAIYAAAAGAGVAYWWMTGWTRAVNVEAFAAFRPAPDKETTTIEIVAEPVAVADSADELVEEVVVEPLQVVESALSEAAEVETPVIEAVVDQAPMVSEIADDLTRISGVGPKLSAALAERGVLSFAQIAAWTGEDLARFDAELALKGRAVREAWVAQAGRLAAAH